ncbi:tetratricopeptide repeat protein [Nocardia asiatica]|uniref:tetratricopeptide repeat protein n=1 Tax=Nocardia asiatica TaxID=209252 RepID=UPI003EE41CF9
MTEGVTGHQEDSARARFAAELAALRGRSAVTADDISDWIRHRRSRTVAPSTISDWLKPQPTISRTDEKFLLVVECLYAAVSEQWTTAARERWKKLRAAAYAEVRPGTQRTRGADIGTRDAEPSGADENRRSPASVVVGLVPQQPVHFVDREQFRDLSSTPARLHPGAGLYLPAGGHGNLDDPGGEQQLAEELGCLPLALAAAAAAITTARPPLTYETYLQRLQAQPLPRALRRRDGADHPLRADQAILLSLKAAEAATDDPDLDTVVRWLLGLFAVLAPSGVQRELLRHPDQELDELVDEAIDRCTQHSLLNWSTEEDRLLAHRLTARVLLERARDASTGDELLTHALAVLTPQLFDTKQAWARRAEGVDLLDQIEAIWASDLPAQAAPNLRDRTLLIFSWASHFLIEAANLDRAITVGEYLLVDSERLLGADNPGTLRSRNNLAHAYDSVGRFGEAILLFERNLDDSERVLGLDHPGTLTARNNLASAYDSVGRFGEAILLFERNLTDRERVLGLNHPDTLIARNNLAHAYKSAGGRH